MPHPFAWDTTYSNWRTVGDFAAYLATLSPADWIKKIVLHHTVSPLPENWRGVASMKALEKYYRDEVPWTDETGKQRKGWWSAPQLFVCLGAPRPEWNGVFQGTPINTMGTHAGECNDESIGIEVVGRFDTVPWSSQLHVFMLDLLSTLCRWRGLTEDAIIGHRDCGSPKSCPGLKVDLSSVRGQVGAVLSTDKWVKWGNQYPLPAEQRGFGIPQTWNPAILGEARSYPVYKDGPAAGSGDTTVTQLFEHGLIWYRAGQGHIVLYKDLK